MHEAGQGGNYGEQKSKAQISSKSGSCYQLQLTVGRSTCGPSVDRSADFFKRSENIFSL